MEEDSRGTELGNVIRIDDDRVREHLGRIVRGTVEETLNMEENLRRAAERARAVPGTEAIPVRAVVDQGETTHRALLERHGFEVIRHFFLMQRQDLASVVVPPLPAGLEIREVTPDQHRRIFDAEAEAFLDHWEARDLGDEQFATTFARSEAETNLWVVAWDGDEVAGVVQTVDLARGERTARRPARLAGAHQRATAVATARPRSCDHSRGDAPPAHRWDG